MNLALTCVSAKNDYRRPNGSARKEIQGVLFTCVCMRFQACAGRRVASARKARGLKCTNGGAQKPQLLSFARSLPVHDSPFTLALCLALALVDLKNARK